MTTLLLVFVTACSGGSDLVARFDVSSPSPGGRARQAQPERTIAAGKLKPPAAARMFAGTASQVGQLTRYCKNAACELGAASTPQYLTAPVGAFVLFTLGETPVEARTEVRTGPSDTIPAVVKLSPSTLMVFNHGLPVGRYLVDLLVTWRTSEARWRFGIAVKK